MKVEGWYKSALREPLVHFLIAGLAVFVFTSLGGPEIDPNSRKIVLNENQVERLTADWQRTWQREPTPSEIDAIIREFIKEEIYFREAIRIGLDKDDLVIRRRLRSKMEYLSNSAAESQVPNDTILQAWLDQNLQKYVFGAKYGFEQIYFNAETEAAANIRANAILTNLRNGSDWHNLGDAISLPPKLDDEDIVEISKVFGDEFGVALGTAPINIWSGPIASGFGFHIVRIVQKSEGQTPRLAEVRTAVENDWRAKTTTEREQKSYQALLDGYEIEIVKPK